MCKVKGPQCYSSDLSQGSLEVPCRFVFHGTSKLLTKLSRLLQTESPNCKIPKESECEPALATADVDNPCKKHKIKEEAASAVIPVHETTIDTASLKVWIAFGHKVMTEADKEIVRLGELLTDKHMNFAQALIKKQFNDLSGLHCTLTISQLQAPMISENVLQILHISGNHGWWHQKLVVLLGREICMIQFTVKFLM